MKYRRAWIALLSGVALLTAGCDTTSTAILSEQPQTKVYTPSKPSSQQTITVIGASTPYPALEKLAEAYQADNKNVQVELLDSSQSSGGIAGVKAGLVALGTVTRSPNPEEADDSLIYRELAKDALLVATHPSVEGIDGLTTENLKAIYSGQVTNWSALGGPDASIVVLDRAEDTSAKRLLREHYLGEALDNAPDAIMLRRESDVIEALQNTPYSIGTLSLATVTAQAIPINQISLDGIAPTPKTLETGEYKMRRTLGLVWSDTPAVNTEQFIEFIFSSRGADVLQQEGFTPSHSN